MEHKLHEEFFVGRVRRLEVIVCHTCAEMPQFLKVLGHVCRQHCLDDDQTRTVVLRCRHINGPVA